MLLVFPNAYPMVWQDVTLDVPFLIIYYMNDSVPDCGIFETFHI